MKLEICLIFQIILYFSYYEHYLTETLWLFYFYNTRLTQNLIRVHYNQIFINLKLICKER